MTNLYEISSSILALKYIHETNEEKRNFAEKKFVRSIVLVWQWLFFTHAFELLFRIFSYRPVAIPYPLRIPRVTKTTRLHGDLV